MPRKSAISFLPESQTSSLVLTFETTCFVFFPASTRTRIIATNLMDIAVNRSILSVKIIPFEQFVRHVIAGKCIKHFEQHYKTLSIVAHVF
jgi:phosphoribosylaminoimidazole-succinocarboxamide synthase